MTTSIHDNPLRILVTTPSAQPEIPVKAALDLAFPVHMQGLDSAALVNQVVQRPDSFDLVQLEYWMVQHALAAGSLQGIPVSAIAEFDNLLPLFTAGKVAGNEVSLQGTTPHTVQYLDGADALIAHGNLRDYLSLAPTVCNSDSLGWRTDRTTRELDSWGDLFASDLRGRVALSRIASVSIVEAALGCEALGLVLCADKGNMSRDEIDAIIAVVRGAWRAGQFAGTWRSFEESVLLMTAGPVALQSLWPPAVSALRGLGVPLQYRPLREGGRGWAGGFALAAHLRGDRLAAALDYINWYLSGWAGARLSRQGYYSSVPMTARRHLTSDEWNYWYEGLPAQTSIPGPAGDLTEPAGSIRDGGSFASRMGHIAVWSGRMQEHFYLQVQWNQLMAEMDTSPNGM